MTKLKLLLASLLVIGLLFSTAVVLASPVAPAPVSKPIKTTTPGAKATEQAANSAMHQSSKGAPGAVATAKAVTRDSENGKEKLKERLGALQVFQGTVQAVGSNSLELKLASNDVVTFVVSDTVKVNMLSVISNAKLSDVPIGARALVQARSGANGSLFALRINVFAPKPERLQRVGTVIAYTPGVSITIRGPSGVGNDDDVVTGTQIISATYIVTTATVILPADRASQLAVGSRVTIVAPSAASKGSQLVAQVIVVHPATERDVDKRTEDLER